MIIINIKINGINISYEIKGSGKEIILLHGWGCSKETFDRIKYLIDGYKIITLDLPGFGESKIADAIYLDEVVEILNEFIKGLNITSPIILGHSYGGRVGILYAAKYEVSSLILLASAGIKRKLKINKRIKVLVYKTLKRLNINLNIGSNDYKNADIIKRKMLIEAVNKDLKKELSIIDKPTLIINGELDKDVLISDGMLMNKLIKNSIFIKLEDAGHFLYLEYPNSIALIIKSFLEGNSI